MIKPNFFFIGAPKCGTTSIAHTLSQHPEIFISNPKEPHFFEKEIPRGISSLQAYEALFLKAEKHHKILGEASTGYLYSETAIPAIRSYSPDAKFLVAIRNPYEMAVSLHSHALRGNYENQHDFNIAWKLQKFRRMGSYVPKRCPHPLLLLYEDRCAIGDQIERLYNMVPSENVCLVFFDDLKNNPGRLYSKIYRFLQVSDIGDTYFPVLNRKKDIRWPFLTIATRALGKAKRAIGINESFGIADRLIEIVSKEPSMAPSIDDDVWKMMDETFMPQIKKIAYLSDRKLSHWHYYRNYC